MAEAGTISFKLVAATQAFQSGMQKAQSSLGGFKNSLTSLKGAIAGAGIVGLGKQFTSLARTQVEAEQRLAGAIRATGAAIDATKLKQYAADLQKVTTFGDETTISAAAMLVPFGMTEDQITAMLPRLQDFSAAMGTDLTTAAKLFGRAIESGQTDLSRYGVALNDTQKELLKNGDASERAALLTDLLNNKFGGMAQEMAQTDFGKYQQAMNNIGDSMERIGIKIMPAISSAFEWLATKVEKAIDFLEDMAKFYGAVAELGFVEGAEFFKEQKIQEDFEKATRQMSLKPLVENVEGAVSKAVSSGVKKGAADAKPEFDFSGLDFGEMGASIQGQGAWEMETLNASFQEASRAAQQYADDEERRNRLKDALLAKEEADRKAAAKATAGLFAPALGKATGIVNGFIESGLAGAAQGAAAAILANSKAAKQLAEVFNKIIGVAASVFDTFAGGFVDMLSHIGGLFGGAEDVISNDFTPAALTAAQAMRQMGGGEALEKAWDSLMNYAAAFGPDYQEVTKTLSQEAKDMLAAGINLSAEALEAMTTTTLGPALTEQLTNALSPEQMERFKQSLKARIEDLQDKISAGILSGLATPEDLKRWNDSLANLQGTFDALGGAGEDAAGELGKISDSMTNVPAGLKVALTRFASIEGEAPMTTAATDFGSGTTPGSTPTGGNTMYVETMVVQGATADEIIEEAAKETETQANATDGSLAASNTSSYTFDWKAATNGQSTPWGY